jgi:hypothetical protein
MGCSSHVQTAAAAARLNARRPPASCGPSPPYRNITRTLSSATIIPWTQGEAAAYYR